MISVYQVCTGRGIVDPKQISHIGELVSQEFVLKNLHGRILVEQQEPFGTFKVWAYPDDYLPEIVKHIEAVSAPEKKKRARLTAKKIN